MRNMFGIIVTLALSINFAFAANESIEQTLSVSAAPLQAFQAMCVDWQMTQWNGGITTIADVQPGGAWRVAYPDEHLEEGLFTTVEPGQQLTYSYYVDNVASQVEVLFTKTDQGTEIRIRHSGFGDDSNATQRRSTVAARWEDRAPRLVTYLNSIPGSYSARPHGVGPFPAILLLHDNFGMNRSTRILADSLARAGYYALAVDMFKGDATGDAVEAVRFASLVDNNEALTAAANAFHALQNNPNVIPNRIGVFGLGYGGSMALTLASAEPKVHAVVSWYGTATGDENMYRRISAPVLTVFGDQNVQQPRAELANFSKVLVQAGVRAESLIVQAAPYFADTGYGADYSAAASTQAWRRSLTFLDTELRR